MYKYQGFREMEILKKFGMVVDTDLLNTLSEQARLSPRLRMHYDLRNSPLWIV